MDIFASTNRDSALNEGLFALEEDMMDSKFFPNRHFLTQTWPLVRSMDMKETVSHFIIGRDR